MAKEFNISAVFSVKDMFTQSINKIKESTKSLKETMSEASNSTNKFKEAINSVKSRAANATSSLKNLVTGGFDKVKTGVKNAADSVSKFNAALKGNRVSNAIGSLEKLAAAYLGVKSASSLFKSAINSATEFQNYRNTLNVVMKDTKKAATAFRQYTDYANKTPWTEGEVVSAGVKLKSYGLDGTLDQIKKISDMSAVMNKSLDQGVEAIADAETGELERLKEFGVTKQQIVDMAASMGKNVVNKKGQITDQDSFNNAMFAVMEKKFSGGTENLAKSFTGRMSTIKGLFQKTMADIIGVSNDGTVKANGAFDIVSKRLEDVISAMQNFAANGGAEKVGNVLSEAFQKASQAIDFCKAHMNEIRSISKGVLISFIAFKSISGVFSVFDGIKHISDRYGELKNALKDIGFLEKVTTGYGKFNGSCGVLLNKLGFLLNPINMVKGAFGGVKNTITSIPGLFGKLSSTIISVSGALGNLGVSGVAGIKKLFLGVANVIKNPIGSFKLLLGAGKSAFTAIKAGFTSVVSPAVIVIAIIAVIVAAVVHLWKTNAEFRNHVKTAWVQIQQAMKKSALAIGQILNSIKAFLDNHKAEVQAFKVALGVIWETICAVVKAAIEIIIDTITGIVKIFADIIQLIADLCSGNWKKVWEDFKQIIKDAIDMIKGWWHDLVDFFTNNPITAWVKKKFSGGDESHGEPDPKPSDSKGKKPNGGNIPQNSSGTNSFPGGLTTLHEKGYEVYDLPKGTRVFNHDASVDMINKMAANSSNNNGTMVNVNMYGTVIREEADVDKIGKEFARQLKIHDMKRP